MNPIHEYNARVAVVGAGPAGLGTAIGLIRCGVQGVLLLERWDQPGGIAAKYQPRPGMIPTYVDYPRARVIHGKQFADRLSKRLTGTDVDVRLEASVLSLNPSLRQLTVVDPKHGKYVVNAEAIVLATGAREENICERGWIAGSRTGRVLHTIQLLQLIGYLHGQKKLGCKTAAAAGSDLIGYLAAVKLKLAGVEVVRIVDAAARPQTNWLYRWYFRRWANPLWEPSDTLVLYRDNTGRQCIRFFDGRHASCDLLVLSGQLTPNAELLVKAGIEVQPLTGVPRTSSNGQLSAAGCFIAGNVAGGFHGGYWCYRHGLHVAKQVSRYLASQSIHTSVRK